MEDCGFVEGVDRVSGGGHEGEVEPWASRRGRYAVFDGKLVLPSFDPIAREPSAGTDLPVPKRRQGCIVESHGSLQISDGKRDVVQHVASGTGRSTAGLREQQIGQRGLELGLGPGGRAKLKRTATRPLDAGVEEHPARRNVNGSQAELSLACADPEERDREGHGERGTQLLDSHEDGGINACSRE
jgi:hypothetical protein